MECVRCRKTSNFEEKRGKEGKNLARLWGKIMVYVQNSQNVFWKIP